MNHQASSGLGMTAVKAIPEGAALPEKGSVIPIDAGSLILDPNAPRDCAREFARRYHYLDNIPTLHHHNDTFYAWSGRHYPELEGNALRASVYSFLGAAKCRVRDRLDPTKLRLVPIKPRTVMVNNVLDALAAVTHLPITKAPPLWLGEELVPPMEVVPCANGLLHLPTGRLFNHTPEFFSHSVLEFEYDAHALEPETWLKFLDSLWGEDRESIEALQEFFGLCLTEETRYQKGFMVIGPARSGKGTIGRVLVRLIGPAGVVAPSLRSLGQQFGRAPLIGKKLAYMSDVRVGKRANLDLMAESILSITGEDAQTIDRKFQSAWTGTLKVRFFIVSNEVPQFEDASGALANRFILLLLRESFLGKEDEGLTDRILTEMPGILNWAIAGWKRLRERGRFVQPQSGADALKLLEELSSPIKAFVKECCVVGPGHSIQVSVLHDAYCRWNSEGEGGPPLPVNQFSRDLHAAVPTINVTQPRMLGKQIRVFQGIGWR
jgi:putative DNA primase/helicase